MSIKGGRFGPIHAVWFIVKLTPQSQLILQLFLHVLATRKIELEPPELYWISQLSIIIITVVIDVISS